MSVAWHGVRRIKNSSISRILRGVFIYLRNGKLLTNWSAAHNPKLADWVRVPEILPMQKITTTLLMVIGGALALAAQDSAQSINYTSPTGRYSVLLPSQPKLTTQEIPTSSGNKVSQYLAAVGDSSVTYMVAYFDYSAANTFSFDKGRDGMLANVKGTLLNEKSVSLGGYPGREVNIAANASAGVAYIVHARFYDVNKRIYLIQFIIPKSDDTSEAEAKATRFFDSFNVVKTP